LFVADSAAVANVDAVIDEGLIDEGIIDAVTDDVDIGAIIDDVDIDPVKGEETGVSVDGDVS
jgi:hypothetical protein